MKKTCKKLILSRETLRHLQANELRGLWGGDSFAYDCESGSCPNDCVSVGCDTAAACGPSAGCTQTALYDTCPCG
jgi:hypothetical protein